MKSTKMTPMIKQYLAIKDAYPEAILFYRMGDFYEMFFDDAKIASQILEITLTARNKNDSEPVPMCGVPYRAAKGYIARLVESGRKVAVCDQVEDPAQAKGLVKREVVRVITPGMIVEDEFLDRKTNNYILSLFFKNDIYGMACLDISTGGFRVAESSDTDRIIEEIHRVSPSEILMPKSMADDGRFSPIVRTFSEKALGFLENDIFAHARSREVLLDHFKVFSLEGFGCESLKNAVCAAGGLLQYVSETQKQPLPHLTHMETDHLDQYMAVDENSCKNLELMANLRTGSRQGTLISVLDETVTAMGGRLLKKWLRYPLKHHQDVEDRLDAVDEARQNMRLTGELRDALKSVYDLQRINSKIAMGHANARDLIALKQSLKSLPPVQNMLASFSARLLDMALELGPLNALADIIERAIREDAPPTVNDGGLIRTGYNSDLDELIEISRDGKGWLARLEVDERKKTGINSLKVRYNKVFGYYIEVSKTHSASVPEDYIRKQTLVNAERYITDELKTFEARVLNAQEKRAALEYELFTDIRNQVIGLTDRIQAAADHVANLDCLLGLAHTADKNSYHRPRINPDGEIAIENGRHPVIEKMITGERFVPNSILLDNTENQVLIITGPNMAGKSTVLRQVALIVIMAQMGSFVPADKASVCMIDKIFTRVGALDNLASGQSTFMVEMQETANILNNATKDSLVIMDEIGRGTSTFDGLSIAWAVAEHLHDLNGRGVKTLFATHYHNLTDLVHTKARAKNFHIAVKEWNDEIIFLRKLVAGGTSRSYGIQVARLAGIPDPVIDRAKTLLFNIENEDNALTTISKEKGTGAENKKGHVQLGLFHKAEEVLLETLRHTDISRMTPMDAMNCLNDLIEKSRSL